MSISVALLPLTIVLSLTAKTTEAQKKSLNQLEPMQTIFNNHSLLEQTLREHGLAVMVLSESHLISQVGEARLDYQRQTAEEPFWVTVTGVSDANRLVAELECFEHEYKQNVQSYTYNKLIENLNADGMKVVNETLMDDNSILLTIDI